MSFASLGYTNNVICVSFDWRHVCKSTWIQPHLPHYYFTPTQGPPPAVASTKSAMAARRQLLLFVMIAVVFAFSEAFPLTSFKRLADNFQHIHRALRLR